MFVCSSNIVSNTQNMVEYLQSCPKLENISYIKFWELWLDNQACLFMYEIWHNMVQQPTYIFSPDKSITTFDMKDSYTSYKLSWLYCLILEINRAMKQQDSLFSFRGFVVINTHLFDKKTDHYFINTQNRTGQDQRIILRRMQYGALQKYKEILRVLFHLEKIYDNRSIENQKYVIQNPNYIKARYRLATKMKSTDKVVIRTDSIVKLQEILNKCDGFLKPWLVSLHYDTLGGERGIWQEKNQKLYASFDCFADFKKDGYLMIGAKFQEEISNGKEEKEKVEYGRCRVMIYYEDLMQGVKTCEETMARNFRLSFDALKYMVEKKLGPSYIEAIKNKKAKPIGVMVGNNKILVRYSSFAFITNFSNQLPSDGIFEMMKNLITSPQLVRIMPQFTANGDNDIVIKETNIRDQFDIEIEYNGKQFVVQDVHFSNVLPALINKLHNI